MRLVVSPHRASRRASSWPAACVMSCSLVLVAGILGSAGCANDPVYIPAPMTMEAGFPDMTGMPTVAKAQLQLPIKTETAADTKTRAALAAKLAPVMVPYVKVGDIEVEIEWTVRNLDMNPGQAKIELNGANEYFSYDPSIIKLSNDPEAPPTPGLGGDIPIDVPGDSEVSGLFTEDQLREASIDLDQITRGNVNPFRAMLTISKNTTAFQPLTLPMLNADNELVQDPVGNPIPREAFAEITRIDLVFKPTTHMLLDYNVRVRDLRGIMHSLLLAAVTEKPGELQTFNPMVYNPPPPPLPPEAALAQPGP